MKWRALDGCCEVLELLAEAALSKLVRGPSEGVGAGTTLVCRDGPLELDAPPWLGQRAAKWSSALQTLHLMTCPSRPVGFFLRPNPLPLEWLRFLPFP